MARGLLHPDLLITNRMALRDIDAAFAQVDREEGETLKVVLDVQEA
jgi:threonine dehydrogenase-like Zn-dependent dehydrogenase